MVRFNAGNPPVRSVGLTSKIILLRMAAMTYTATIRTPLGPVLASSNGESLTGLWFAGQKHFPPQAAEWPARPELPVFTTLRNWLSGYFAGEKPEITLRLEPQGTVFQKTVWTLLQDIPYGSLSTYGAIAGQINPHRAPTVQARAVGAAVGHNPISLLIPCHRVIGADGNLTGYAGGIDKKMALLRLEGAVLTPARK
ncbi:MAG: methylated-DNA--[protein]-cysteine S-methyltransferase [Treponema sp.]|nr:methylated-DNA--[protein]-cysteine S-methyltransferase [Treponema sp.]